MEGEEKMGVWALLLYDTGKFACMLGIGVLRLMFFSAPEDVFCPGPGLGMVCHRPFDHGREGGRCVCCHLMSKDRELQYLAFML